jgi:hypothetical protein
MNLLKRLAIAGFPVLISLSLAFGEGLDSGMEFPGIPECPRDTSGHVWLSLTPAGPPVTSLTVSVGDTFTLQVVFEFDAIGTECPFIPIGHDSGLEVLEAKFHRESFDFHGYCLDHWNFFPEIHPEERIALLWAWTPVYPACCTPEFSVLDLGHLTFTSVDAGSSLVKDTLWYGLPPNATMCAMA